MKNRRALVLFLAVFGAPLFISAQQTQFFPWWDYRSSNWLNGRIGVGMQFSNQNRQLYFFAESDICFSCAYNHFVRPPEDLHQQIALNRYRGNLHLKFQTSKDFKLYGTRFSPKSDSAQFKNLSWTYLTAVGMSADAGFYRPGRIADLETGQLNASFRNKGRMRLRYDLVSRYHSYYYRKLSNTVGYVTLTYAKLDDRWGVNLNWGNDVFILKSLRRFVINHDHGETNSIYLTGYIRPNEKKRMDANTVFDYQPEHFQKLEFGGSLRMITDRKVARMASTNDARAGSYQVVNLQNSFHGYYGIRLRAETGFYGIGGLFGKDDLLWGRDMQRFAHQGYAHLPLHFARKIAIRATNGVGSPLFPWERQPMYYKKPTFYYELNTDLLAPLVQWK